jgi:hypothetical protein
MSGRCGWRAVLVLVALGFAPFCLGRDAAAEVPAEVVPRLFQTRPGRFEIVVPDGIDPRRALALGESVWSALSGVLSLPGEGFSTPVTVRLVPVALWTGPDAFTVVVEPPGLVSVRVRWGGGGDVGVARRAMVRGLILRQAAAWHGVAAKLTAAGWLEQACVGLSIVRERPAMMDAYQQDAVAAAAVPSLSELLRGDGGTGEARVRAPATLWLLLQLQVEPAAGVRWAGWVRGITAGADPLAALPRAYPGLWADASAMELWWLTAFQAQSRQRLLPLMTAADSRAWLQDRSRWLAERGGEEVVLDLEELPGLRRTAWGRAELSRRLGQLRAVMGTIHPYYANAALSLGRIYEAALKGDESAVRTALADLQREVDDGRELEETIGAILDTAPRD